MNNDSMNDNTTEERRRAIRVNTDLSINYQIISRYDALKDPYSANFAIPRYLLLSAELEEVDIALNLKQRVLNERYPELWEVTTLLNQKINTVQKAFYETVIKALLPSPSQVNISESGLSFVSSSRISSGTHLHLSLTHLEQELSICTTVRVVYCEEIEGSDGYKIGAYFIGLHPKDHAKLAEMIDGLHGTYSIDQ